MSIGLLLCLTLFYYCYRLYDWNWRELKGYGNMAENEPNNDSTINYERSNNVASRIFFKRSNKGSIFLVDKKFFAGKTPEIGGIPGLTIETDISNKVGFMKYFLCNCVVKKSQTC